MGPGEHIECRYELVSLKYWPTFWQEINRKGSMEQFKAAKTALIPNMKVLYSEKVKFTKMRQKMKE